MQKLCGRYGGEQPSSRTLEYAMINAMTKEEQGATAQPIARIEQKSREPEGS